MSGNITHLTPARDKIWKVRQSRPTLTGWVHLNGNEHFWSVAQRQYIKRSILCGTRLTFRVIQKIMCITVFCIYLYFFVAQILIILKTDRKSFLRWNNRMHNKAMCEIMVDINNDVSVVKMHTERPQIINSIKIRSINIYRRIAECLREQWSGCRIVWSTRYLFINAFALFD